jgi:hypothetical protein
MRNSKNGKSIRHPPSELALRLRRLQDELSFAGRVSTTMFDETHLPLLFMSISRRQHFLLDKITHPQPGLLQSACLDPCEGPARTNAKN